MSKYAFRVEHADGRFAGESRTQIGAEKLVRRLVSMSRGKSTAQDWKIIDQRKKNPSRASVIYAQRKGRKGEVMYFDGKKFTNNVPPKYFGTHDRARGVAQSLVSRFTVL